MKHIPAPLKSFIFLFFGGPLLWALPPEAAVKKLQAPAPGVEPLVLFLSSAKSNEGTGEARWAATSGTPLQEIGRDPWGDAAGAFGPSEGAASGAAIASSIESPLLTSETGTFLLCLQVPQVTGDPLMILSRGTWGDRTAFDLRADKNGDLIIYVGPGSKPQKLPLGKFIPGTWMFIGVSWKKIDDKIQMETSVAELDQGHSLESQTFTIPNAGEPSAPVLIAGRTNRDLSVALLEGGLYSSLAIYGDALSEETIKSVFTELTQSLKL